MHHNYQFSKKKLRSRPRVVDLGLVPNVEMRRSNEWPWWVLIELNGITGWPKKQLEWQQLSSCTSFTLALSLSCGKDQPKLDDVRMSQSIRMMILDFLKLKLLSLPAANVVCSTDGWILGSGDPPAVQSESKAVLSSENLNGFLQLLSRLLCCEWVHETKEAKEDVCNIYIYTLRVLSCYDKNLPNRLDKSIRSTMTSSTKVNEGDTSALSSQFESQKLKFPALYWI